LAKDPDERTNLVGKHPQVAQRLRGRLQAMLKKLETGAQKRGPSTVDPEAVKRLESLGYVSGGVPLPTSAVDITREDPKDFLPTFIRLLQTKAQFFYAHRTEEAKQELLRIVATRPDLILPHKLLAVIALDERRPADAVEQYAKIVALLGELKGSSKQRFGAKEELAMAHFGLGLGLSEAGKLPEAITHYRKALEIKPDYAAVHNDLGNALANHGQVDEAITHYRKALEINPDYMEAHNDLGNALADHGQVDEAITHYRKALEINPNYAEAHNNLGYVLADHGQVDEAITHYRKALEIKPDFVEAHNNFAVALAVRGRLDEALAHYQKALILASAHNDKALADVIRARIRLLRSGAPASKTP
jgi:tetratricopeptide (TPR) repeat protein